MLDPSRTLYENVLTTIAAAPDRPGFTFLDAALRPTTYTYAQLFACIDEIARRFAAYRLPRGATIGILLETQESQVLHYLAALSLGFVPAILTPPNRKLSREYYEQTMRALMAYCRFSAVITDLADIGSGGRVLHPFSLCEIQSGGEDGTLVDAAFLQFSSGTTGIKRGVPVGDEAVLRQLIAYAQAIDLQQDDCIISWLPLYHDMGLIASLNMALAYGVHSVMMHPLDWVANPGMYVRAVFQQRGTLGWNPNFAYALMADRVRDIDLAGVDLSSLRGLVNCSEPVTKISQDRFLQRFAPHGLHGDVFWGCYAMAETTFALTHGSSSDPGYLDDEGPRELRYRPAEHPFVSVGRPLDGVQLLVVDEAGQPCPEHHMGELWAKSLFNAGGYYNNPAATAAAFHDGWYRTGDLGYQAGGEFFVCGRKKDLLIIGGVNIHPQDMEDVVSATPGIQPGRVAVFGVFNAQAQTERAVILAETDVGEEQKVPLVVEIRRRVLSAFQITNFEVHLLPQGWLIKSSAGKMARRANREKWQRGPDTTP